MPSVRNILSLNREASEPKTAPTQFRVTLSPHTPKGPKPISFLVEAPNAKQAQKDAYRLIMHGKFTVEAV